MIAGKTIAMFFAAAEGRSGDLQVAMALRSSAQGRVRRAALAMAT